MYRLCNFKASSLSIDDCCVFTVNGRFAGTGFLLELLTVIDLVSLFIEFSTDWYVGGEGVGGAIDIGGGEGDTGGGGVIGGGGGREVGGRSVCLL